MAKFFCRFLMSWTNQLMKIWKVDIMCMEQGKISCMTVRNSVSYCMPCAIIMSYKNSLCWLLFNTCKLQTNVISIYILSYVIPCKIYACLLLNIPPALIKCYNCHFALSARIICSQILFGCAWQFSWIYDLWCLYFSGTAQDVCWSFSSRDQRSFYIRRQIPDQCRRWWLLVSEML